MPHLPSRIPLFPTLPPFQRRAVALALVRMLTGPRFDVCTLRQALDVAGVEPPRAAFEALRLHHCARYADLPPGFHAELAAHTLRLFAGPTAADALPLAALQDLAHAAGLDPSAVPSLYGLTPAAQA